MNSRVIIITLACTLLLSCTSQKKGTYSSYSPAEINLIKAKNWLAVNVKREGVVQTESGLQYKILKASNGCKIDSDYKVTVHYEMVSVASKKVIDSSYQRGNPNKFRLSKMIAGWKEGVPMMKVGEVWAFYMPANLAYGKRGLPGSVAPNSVLASEVKLIDGRCQD